MRILRFVFFFLSLLFLAHQSIAQCTANFSFNPNNSCSGSILSFTNTSTGINLQYNWNFGDGNTSSLTNPNHAYNFTGTGTQTIFVTLTVATTNGCSNSITKQIIVKKTPDVSYNELNNFITCLSSINNISVQAQISNYSASIGDITAYTVNWGDGGGIQVIPLPFDGTHPITHNYTALGSFLVTIAATGSNGCTSTYSHNYVIETNPVASIVGPSIGTNVGCAPLTVSIINTSTNITATTTTTVTWGDGTSTILPIGTTNNVASHTYNTSSCQGGTTTPFIISLTAQNLCDASSTTWSPIKVFKAPQAIFTVPNTVACVGSPITFSNQTISNNCASNPATIYTWDFGDGTIVGPAPNLMSETHTYSSPGNYLVTLTAANNSTNGCGSTDTTLIVKISDVIPQFFADTVCEGSVTTLSDLSTTVGSTIQSWYWSFNDDGIPWYNDSQNHSPAQDTTHTFTHAGTFNVELKVTDINGCEKSIIKTVVVDSLPFVDFTASPFCLGSSTTFNNTTQTTVNSSISGLSWNFGDGSNSTLQNPSHIFAAANTYNVSLSVNDSKGCSASKTKQITAYLPPTAAFSSATSCSSTQVSFADQSTSPAGAISAWSWNFGDGTTSALQNPVHAYASNNTFSVTLIITDISGCKDTITKTITSFLSITPNFTTTSVCEGQNTCFTDISTSTGGAISSWSWSFNDSNVPWYSPWQNSSSSQNPCHTYTQGGTYDVNLNITDQHGCTGTVTLPVVVSFAPVAVFSNNSATLGNPTNFTDLSTGTGISAWSWNFGDGSITSSSQNPQHTYATAGTFSVSLTVTNNSGCSVTITQSVTVINLPQPNFSATTVCLGNSTVFTDMSTSAGGQISAWLWNFGEVSSGTANTSTSQNPSHTYNSASSFIVTLIVRDINGVSDTVVKTITVNTLPTPQFAFDTVCGGSTTHFTDLSIGTISSNAWNFGDDGVPWYNPSANQSTLQNPMHDYTHTGSFTANLTVTGFNGCSATISHNIFVSPTPTAAFAVTNVLVGNPTVFTDNSIAGNGSITGCTWDFGDANTSVLQNPSHTYAAAGIYTVTLTATNTSGCTQSITQQVTVYGAPVTEFTWANSCIGQNTSFTDASVLFQGTHIDEWHWNFGDGGSATSQNPTHSFASANAYLVTLIVKDNNNVWDTASHLVIIYPLPTANFSTDTVCVNDTTHFSDLSVSAAGSITAWNWTFGDDGVPWWNLGSDHATTQHPSHIYTHGGTFNADVTITDIQGCSQSVSHTVLVSEQPTAQFSANNAILGDPTNFADNSIGGTGSITSWSWTFGDGASSTTQYPSHTYITEGTYNVCLTVTNVGGCINTHCQEVHVFLGPHANFLTNKICLNDTTHFIDNTTSPGGVLILWNWNFGDIASGTANTSTIQNPYHHYGSIGTYTVQLTVKDINGIIDTITKQITIHAIPTANFSADTACFDDPVHFTDQSSNVNTYLWDFNDGYYASISNPLHHYDQAGTYHVLLHIMDTFGCEDTISKSILVKPAPNANFKTDTVCPGSGTHFIDLSTGIGAGSVWNYNFGDGQNSSTQNPTHIFSNGGTFNTLLTVTNINGCNNTISKPIYVKPAPTADFYANSVMLGSVTNFTNTSNSPNGNISSYNWNFGDGLGGSSLQNPTYTYLNAGSYSVMLIVTDDTGCADTIIKTVVIFSPTEITASFTFEIVCKGDSTQFTDLSVTPNGIVTNWNWNFGDGSNATIQHPSHFYPSAGIFSVTLIVEDNTGASDTITQYVMVNQSPNANFSATSVLAGQVTSFNDNSTGGVSSWLWNFGSGGATSTLQNPTYTYPAAGQYHVMLVVINTNGCSDTIYKNIIVVSPFHVVAAFNAQNVCLGATASFSDLSSSPNGAVSSWFWTFGDGQSSNLQNPNHTYLSAGTFSVKLVVTDVLASTDSVTVLLTVYPTPIADFSYITNCETNTILYTNHSQIAGGTVTSWQWNFGDGAIGFTVNPQHTYASAGNYSVILTASSNLGCSDTDMLHVVLSSSPVAAFSSSPNCVGYSTFFLDSSSLSIGTIDTWYWAFGDGSTSTLQNPAHTYSSAGDYQVSLIAETNAGCVDSLTQTVIINFSPVANFNTASVCQRDMASFNDLSGIAVGSINGWLWNFGDDSTTVTNQNPNHVFNLPGVYNTTLIVTSDKGCMDTVKHPIIIYPLPELSFNNSVGCINAPINFTNNSQISSGTVTTWHWNFGDGVTSSMQNPNHTYQSAGTFVITLIAISEFGCKDSLKKNIIVSPKPNADFTNNTSCMGTQTVFNNQSTVSSGTIAQWTWKFGDGNTSSLASPNHMYSMEGQYIVNLYVTTLEGCKDTITKVIEVNSKPEANFATENNICVKNKAVFLNNSTINSGAIIDYNWSFGDGYSINTENSSHNYFGQGSYEVVLTVVSNKGCKDSIMQLLTVHPPPVKSLENNITLCDDETKTLNAGNAGATYLWSTGSTSQTIEVGATNQTYWVYVQQFGCHNTDSATVTECKKNIAAIPNAFSPNDDGNNDILFVYGNNIAELSFSVFNRFGEEVFVSKNISDGWDGKRKGIKCEVEVYVYYLTVKFLDGEFIEKSGNVSLLR